MHSGPIVLCLVAAAGAVGGAALMMEPPGKAAAKPVSVAALTVINPVATEDVGTLTRLASEMTARGEYAQAAEALSRAIDLGLDTADLHVERGMLRLRLGRTDAAREDFNSALSLEEDSAPAVAGMGLVLLTRGEHANAMKCFDLAIGRDANLGIAWRGRGEALAAMDDHTAAVEALDEALRLNDRDVQALVLRARSRALVNNAGAALVDAKRAIELAPYDMGAWYTLGSLHLLRREFDETIRAADRALAVDPSDVDMLALRAWAKSARGSRKGAAEDAEAALGLAPDGWRHRDAMRKIADAVKPAPTGAASSASPAAPSGAAPATSAPPSPGP